MNYAPSSLYHSRPYRLEQQLADAIEQGLRRAGSNNSVEVFFRADDIGVPSEQFAQLVSMFQKHALPLCLATVPSWLTRTRLIRLRQLTGEDDTLWCWHQHGRMHRNYEVTGKKQEFGPARDAATVKRHLRLGKERLEMLLEDAFQPFFTPPWNRCSLDAIRALQELKFQGLSRNRGAKPIAHDLLPDFQVNVDLHTRKEPDPEVALTNLLSEIEAGFTTGRCGIMIHHQRMNRQAFDLLETLLGLLAKTAAVLPRRFPDMIL